MVFVVIAVGVCYYLQYLTDAVNSCTVGGQSSWTTVIRGLYLAHNNSLEHNNRFETTSVHGNFSNFVKVAKFLLPFEWI